jgi:hypothetical protein
MSVLRYMREEASSAAPAMLRGAQLALALLVCGVVIASAQAQPQREFQGDAVPHPYVPPQAQPSQPSQDVPPRGPQADAEPARTPGHRPGFLDALGRWFGDPRAAFESQMKNTQEALGTMGDQAREAASSVVTIPGTRVITGRQLCPTAANGAPDCQPGVDALCRAKGFQNGRSLDVTSGQRCPARVYIENRPPKEGECRMETYVTRAVCQ